MELFIYEGYTVDIDPKALYITAFKDVWKKYRNKEYALAEFAYIWFVGSFTSDFSHYIDGGQRRAEVLESVFASNKDKLKIDEKTELAIKKLEELQETPALSLLKAAHQGVDKLKTYIRDTDIDANDGREATALMKVIADTPGVVKSLMSLEEQIKIEADSKSKIKGQKVKGIFEDA